MTREGSMKIGCWMVALFLVVMGVGCKTESKPDHEAGLRATEGSIEVSRVDKWEPSGTGQNPRLAVREKQTVFVFDSAKRMRARLHMTQSRTLEVPLVQLRNGGEPLFYGVAEPEAWDWKDEGGIKLMCVRCRQNVGAPQFWEPCCPVNANADQK
jgi:hypothetical protein